MLPRGPAILGITDINTRFGGAFPLPRRRRGLSGDDHRHRGRRAAAGPRRRPRGRVVMTRFLDQTILRREPRGLAPSRASTRVRRTWSARSPSDYGRVLWGGRWLILAATVIAALALWASS